MKNNLEIVKKNLGVTILCLFEIVAGILLFIHPVNFTMGIIVGIGIVLFTLGILSIISYFKTEPGKAAIQQSLAKGLLFATAGLFCMLKSQWFIATFPLLTILYGIIILITGLLKIQWAVDMLRMKIQKWFFAAIGAALSLLFAAVILMNPFESTVFLWRFVAISLILEAILDIVTLFFNYDRKKETEKMMQD